VIGREEDAAAWIESASVSRQHARIVVSEGRAALEDLASRSGATSSTARRASCTEVSSSTGAQGWLARGTMKAGVE
jgi:pSer/pThr/pTyr-binding forkhead associated (FHA) protein